MTDPKQTTSVLILTGTVGVGKSSVADAIFEILQSKSESAALINIDEFGYVSPRSSGDPYNQRIRLKNLETVWRNYAELGTKLVIIPAVIENTGELDTYKQAIPGAHFLVVRLDASPGVIEARIRNRLLGGDETWHLKRAPELVELMESNHIEDVIIDTDDKTISVVANEVLLTWPNK